ncbi:hypothetical protein E0H38_24000 [Rhizobium leguminosarum bv. viciae]|nr:hypothetical protein E0H32_14755 [Rhizobium leguminosarum bv. viciae]TBZ11787.1 hypothetical protein E0H38_24000 [Rhizobium leguminosarum bv. viciae]
MNPRIGPKIGTDFRKARCVDLKCWSVLMRPRGRTALSEQCRGATIRYFRCAFMKDHHYDGSLLSHCPHSRPSVGHRAFRHRHVSACAAIHRTGPAC